MTAWRAGTVVGVRRWFLGADDRRSLGRIGAVVLLTTALDRATRRLARLGPGDDAAPVLLARAATSHVLVAGLLVVGFLGLFVEAGSRGRFVGAWDRLDHGRALRWLMAAPLLLTGWYGAAYPVNYVTGQWHVIDRAAVVVLVIAAWARPAFLVPAVVAARIVAAQFTLPLGATASQNIGNLVLVALLVVGATHFVASATGDPDSSPALVALAVAIGAHFFVPGRTKLGLRWWSGADPGDFALSSYTAGWRGAGDGSWARALNRVLDAVRLPMIAGTLLVEVGAFIAVCRRRLLRLWLAAAVAFHVVVFATSGFWLFEWMVLEVGLFVVLGLRRLRTWVARNDTPVRGVLAGTFVLLGGLLFQPPRLAWYDSPVAYGYEVEATGLSGRTYHVPLRQFAPFEQDMSFVFATFQPQRPLAGGYGALAWRGTLDALTAVDTFEQLDALERQGEPTPPGRRAASEALVGRWLERTYSRDRLPLVPIPPPRYVTSRAGPAYDGDEPLRSAEVVLVRSIEDGGRQRFTRQPLLRVEADASGHAVVSWRVEDGAAP